MEKISQFDNEDTSFDKHVTGSTHHHANGYDEKEAAISGASSDDTGESAPHHTEDSGVHLSTPVGSPCSTPLNDVKAGSVANHNENLDRSPQKKSSKTLKIRWRAIITMVVLCFVNTLNYMDRYTLPAVLDAVMEHFDIDFAKTGLLQTVFVCSYMLVSPVFGYLGDHYMRIYIIGGGVAFWSVVTLASSFVPRGLFGIFVLTRALVGVGEASYVTVAPSLIGDLFGGESRSTAIAVFSLTTPLGSGLGYVVGGALANLTGSWQWALRVTPILGLGCVVAAFTILHEPQRGAADLQMAEPLNKANYEAADNEVLRDDERNYELEPLNYKNEPNGTDGRTNEQPTAQRCNALRAWGKDVKYLLRINTYVFVVLGFTSVCFVAGSVSWFGPSFAFIAFQLNTAETGAPERTNAVVSFLFGLVTCFAGVFGVIIGVFLAKFLRKRCKLDRRADALICGTGMLLSAPLLLATLFVPRHSFEATWFVMIMALISLFITWPLVTDMMLYVIEPHRRASASGLEMLATHLFGDASSPYILGALADFLTMQFALQYNTTVSPSTNFTTMTLADSTTASVAASSTLDYFLTNATTVLINSTSSVNVAKFHALQYSLSVNTVIALLGGAAFFIAGVTILPDHKRLVTKLEQGNSALE